MNVLFEGPRHGDTTRVAFKHCSPQACIGKLFQFVENRVAKNRRTIDTMVASPTNDNSLVQSHGLAQVDVGFHVIKGFLTKQIVDIDVVRSFSALFHDEIAVVEVWIVVVEYLGGREFVIMLCKLCILLGFRPPL